MPNGRDEQRCDGRDVRSTVDNRGDVVRHTVPYGQSPARAIVDAVAAFHDREPTALAPLYPTVDPDALDGLVSRPAPAEAGARVTFEYEGATVDVQQRSQLTVVVAESPPSTAEPPRSDGDGPDGSRGG